MAVLRLGIKSKGYILNDTIISKYPEVCVQTRQLEQKLKGIPNLILS